MGSPQAPHSPIRKTGVEENSAGVCENKDKVCNQPGFNEDFPGDEYEGYRQESGEKNDPSRICSTGGRWEDGQEKNW